jgi:enamine deaminase RidA (YjgF/YER057c/UK114 family)
LSDTFSERLQAMGLELPRAAAPAGAYVPWVRSGALLFVAGQLPVWNGELRYRGRIGTDLTLTQGQAAARLCALNVLAQVRDACAGDLSRLQRAVRLNGFVQTSPDFSDHPQVLNGASDLLLALLGDAGRHTRVAIGAVSLPRGAAVEIDGIFELA